MSLLVNCYGIHTTDEGVKYLHQGRSSANMIGLKAVSPFTVQVQVLKKACPHLINISPPVPDKHQWRIFSRFLQDDLVKEFLPVPKNAGEFIPFLSDTNNSMLMHLVALSRLSSPIFPLVHPILKLNSKQIIEALEMSNISPLVLTNVRNEDSALMYSIANDARIRPRKLIFTGEPSVVVHEPLRRVSTILDSVDSQLTAQLPMESLGAVLLKRYARGEPLNENFVYEAGER